METVINSPLFGVTLTVGSFVLFQTLFKGKKNPFLNPLMFSIAFVILVLSVTQIPYATYAKGGDIISFFLGPVTVALAVPLYKQFDKFKRNALPILVGIVVGVVVAIVSTIGMGLLLGLNQELIISMAPKATTTAIAIDLSETLGGDPSLTVVFVMIAGMTGYLLGEQILNWFKIKNAIAKGIGLGTASHAMGTNRALEIGEAEGAMGSLAIGLAGVVTSFLLPLILTVLK